MGGLQSSTADGHCRQERAGPWSPCFYVENLQDVKAEIRALGWDGVRRGEGEALAGFVSLWPKLGGPSGALPGSPAPHSCFLEAVPSSVCTWLVKKAPVHTLPPQDVPK